MSYDLRGITPFDDIPKNDVITVPGFSEETIAEIKAEVDAEMARREAEGYYCETCLSIKNGEFGPTHKGSAHCQSGSIASGGTKAHCSCEECF